MSNKRKVHSPRSLALFTAIMLLCPLSLGADASGLNYIIDDPQVAIQVKTSIQWQTPTYQLNSYVVDGQIWERDLREVAQDYPKVSDKFLQAIQGIGSMSVSTFKDYAIQHQLPAQYVQRFIDDYFVFKQGTKYQYIPVRDDITRHSYDWSNLVHYDTEKDYVVNGERRAVKVIDVSVHQGNIDWKAVKSDGVDCAFIRVGYRGYSKGGILLDSNFHKNMKGAIAAGVKVGVYFYSQAINVQEAIQEAKFTLQQIQGYQLELPVVFDIEGAQTSRYRTRNLSVQTATNLVKAFCDTVAEAGYEPMLYSYSKFLIENLDLSQLQQYKLWLALYYHVPFFPYMHHIWQYECEGSVRGISRPVDLNLMFLEDQPSYPTVEPQALVSNGRVPIIAPTGVSVFY